MKSFIVCINSTNNWYREDDLYENLKAGETTPVGMSLKYKAGSQIEQGDLVFVAKVSKTKSSLVAIGKAITDYDEDPNISGILIQLDFIQEKGKEFLAFHTLLKEGEINLRKDTDELLLTPEFTEKLLKSLAVHIMITTTQETVCYIHDPNLDTYQLLCNYLNDYCPEFRQEVIKRFPLIYENYKEGEIVDKDVIDLTYDAYVGSSVASDLDWELLFRVVKPRA